MVKGDTGFYSTVKVPWGQKVAYKFIVDGRWQCRDDRPQEDDGYGNINNVLQIPEKPQVVFPAVYEPPVRLSIPLEGAQSSDLETMVTAVEFLPPTEPAVVRGSLPLPIPQISVDGLGLVPSANTPVSISKLVRPSVLLSWLNINLFPSVGHGRSHRGNCFTCFGDTCRTWPP